MRMSYNYEGTTHKIGKCDGRLMKEFFTETLVLFKVVYLCIIYSTGVILINNCNLHSATYGEVFNRVLKLILKREKNIYRTYIRISSLFFFY